MGKTTTANMFRGLGYAVFDADGAVHKLYAKGGKGAALIHAVFPDAVHDGAVNRAALGRHMQADPLNLPVLESFIHPMVAALRANFIYEAEAADQELIIFDVPLLFETGGDQHMDAVIVVTAPPELQRERVTARRGMSAALFEKILSRQMPDAQKRARADYLIFTDKGLDFAKEQLQDILRDIKKPSV